jgi:hypothetical protein
VERAVAVGSAERAAGPGTVGRAVGVATAERATGVAIAGHTVPNFRGMTMRDVLTEAASRGLTILPDGSGIARMQDPPPGSSVRQGERIRVRFAR